jgi:hypothetical protein
MTCTAKALAKDIELTKKYQDSMAAACKNSFKYEKEGEKR